VTKDISNRVSNAYIEDKFKVNKSDHNPIGCDIDLAFTEAVSEGKPKNFYRFKWKNASFQKNYKTNVSNKLINQLERIIKIDPKKSEDIKSMIDEIFEKLPKMLLKAARDCDFQRPKNAGCRLKRIRLGLENASEEIRSLEKRRAVLMSLQRTNPNDPQ
jgi:hypothetical protein